MLSHFSDLVVLLVFGSKSFAIASLVVFLESVQFLGFFQAMKRVGLGSCQKLTLQQLVADCP